MTKRIAFVLGASVASVLLATSSAAYGATVTASPASADQVVTAGPQEGPLTCC